MRYKGLQQRRSWTTALLTVTLLRILDEEVLIRIAAPDGGAAWVFMPFEGKPATFAAAGTGGRVLAAGADGELALFDPATRSCIRRGSLGRPTPGAATRRSAR